MDFVGKVLPTFSPHRPTVLIDYPAAQASLARLKPDNPLVAERAEVFIGGLELANAFSELIDLKEQESRFREAIEAIREERGQTMPLPDKFLKALPRLPECGGVALGVDRLVMLFCDAASIDDVMAFTVDDA
jgi:elongation factor P--(R)-beta-lysine ligase